MYADKITDSMRLAIDETERRRTIQAEYNEKHGITPVSIQKEVRGVIEASKTAEEVPRYAATARAAGEMSAAERKKEIQRLGKEMKQAAKDLEFERAAQLRDLIFKLRKAGKEDGLE